MANFLSKVGTWIGRLVKAFISLFRVGVSAPAHYVVHKHNEENIHKIQERCKDMCQNADIHPQIKHPKIGGV